MELELQSEKTDSNITSTAEVQLLRISFETSDEWLLHETFIWGGSIIDHMPQLSKTGQPILKEFPYVNNNVGGKQQYSHSIPLRDILDSEWNCEQLQVPEPRKNHLFIAVHPVLLRSKDATKHTKSVNNDTSTQQSTQQLRTRSENTTNRMSESGIWWMEFRLQLLLCPEEDEEEEEVTSP
jgi:hypothetical protein